MYYTNVYSLKQLMCQPIAKETLRTTCALYGMVLADKKSHAEVVSPFILCLLQYHRLSTKKGFIHRRLTQRAI
jgi:hypothetical protein